jgi:hypothetical protein
MLPATSSYSAFGVRRSALGVRCFSASSCGPLSVVRSPVPGTLVAIRSSSFALRSLPCRAVVTVLFSSWGGDGFEAVVEGEEEFSHNGG